MQFECSLDNEQFKSCGEGLTGKWTGINIPHGRHNFRVKGTDNFGNIVELEVRGWTVDAVPPMITFTDAPLKTNSLPTLTWRSSEKATFECSLDSGSYENCGSGINGEWSEWIVREGSHVLSVRAKDLVGNIGRPTTHSWIVGKFLSYQLYNIILYATTLINNTAL
jgi:hypothetical protein